MVIHILLNLLILKVVINYSFYFFEKMYQIFFIIHSIYYKYIERMVKNMICKKNFTHLHLHTWFSMLDGYGSPKQRILKGKELGMTAMAITDHNSLAGCYNFQNECFENDMKPLLGVELYFTEDMNMLCISPENRGEFTKEQCKKKASEYRDKIALEEAIKDGVVIPKKATKKVINELISNYKYNTKQFHILFIAKNQIGWNNLVKLQSEAARICEFNARYCCDDNLISKYKDGIIMTTACIGNIVNNYILEGKIDKAYNQLDKWHEMFGDDFYIEIQPLNLDKQAICNIELIKYAITNNINLVATNDVHYTNKEDWDDHDTLVRIGLKIKKNQENKMAYAHEYWLRSYDEMIDAFTLQYNNNDILQSNFTLEQYINIVSEALENTNKISDKVSKDIKLSSDKPVLPKIDVPYNMTSSNYLTLISYEKLFEYLSKHKELDINEYINRLAFELNVITTKGYSDYMLIVKDVLDWCKDNEIPTGPGRGSAGGSLVLFVNEMTKCIDPIKYGLLFGRFLTMDRTSLPDYFL